MTPLKIRRARPKDLDDIRACAEKAYTKYISRMEREPAPMRADFNGQVEKGFIDVAILGEEFVGYVVHYPKGESIHLENIAVLPIFSGRGIGKFLIEHVEISALASGYNRVELYTNEAMIENLSMYPKIGYTEIGRNRESGFNRVFFHKQL